MRCIDQHRNLSGKVVLVRAGLNAPMRNGVVVNDFRIKRALPTLRFLQEQGAKTIVIAHIGREGNETLKPVADVLATLLPQVSFSTRENCVVESLKEGDIRVLENLRQDAREVENDDSFALELAGLADVFVQDAFSVCHRSHASVVGIPKHIDSYGGLLLKAEVEVLTRALNPEHPALFVLGGAKFETKEPLIRKFLDTYDAVFVGGALQNEVLAARGYEVGESVIEDGIVSEDILNNPKLLLVTDVVVDRKGNATTVSIEDIRPEDVIVDVGGETINKLGETVSKYKSILWNGPLGWYERGFSGATISLATATAHSDTESILGGGDTVAVVQQERLEDAFDFISTGGGAMLEFLQKGNLPGIEVLK